MTSAFRKSLTELLPNTKQTAEKKQNVVQEAIIMLLNESITPFSGTETIKLYQTITEEKNF